MPRLWSVTHRHGAATPADFIRVRFGSSTLALGSAFALFMYPHSITAVLSSGNRQRDPPQLVLGQPAAARWRVDPADLSGDRLWSVHAPLPSVGAVARMASRNGHGDADGLC